jgi:(+)-trans-carveol dehydrogenase
MNGLSDKVALISGVARGQGRSHALRLAAAGARIIGFDCCAQSPNVPYEMPNEDDLQKTVEEVEAAGGKILARVADVRSSEQIASVVAEGVSEFGSLDIVVANAGIVSLGSLSWEIPEEEWEEMVSVNLSGVWRTCKAAIPHILAGGRGGSIVMTASSAGIKPMVRLSHYVAVKHGVVGLTKALANELAGAWVRVNCVAPTTVETPMIANDAFRQIKDLHEDMNRNGHNLLDVGMVKPEDISSAVAWLCSDEARYVTGIVLPVDAGATAAV